MTLTDNFGLFLAGHFGIVFSNGSKNVGGFVDQSGITRTIQIYGQTSSQVNWNELANSTVQVGKGTTQVTRQDFNIENPFPNSPESLKIGTGAGGYNSGLGKISFGTLISNVTDNDSVTEVCHFRQFRTNPSNNLIFLMIHDIISPVSFLTGEAINVEHSLLV